MTHHLIQTWLKAFIPHHISNTKVLTGLKILSWKIPAKKIAGNHFHNLEVLTHAANTGEDFFHRNTYIENQNHWNQVKFGSYTMNYSGCEIIASYNALLSLGHSMSEQEMSELISWYEKKGAVLSGGFGVRPTAIYNYFKSNGFRTFLTTDVEPAVINALGRAYDTIIITVYNNADDITAQIHTMNVSKEGKDKFYLHNGYKTKKQDEKPVYVKAGPFPTLWETIRNVSRGNASPVSIIGISNDNKIS